VEKKRKTVQELAQEDYDFRAWGTMLSEFEGLFLEIREFLTEQMLELSLARQAEALPQQSRAARAKLDGIRLDPRWTPRREDDADQPVIIQGPTA